MSIATGTPVQATSVPQVTSLSVSVTIAANPNTTYLAVFTTNDTVAGFDVSSVTDGTNTYTARGNVNDATNKQRIQSFWAGPIAAGTYSVDANLSGSAAEVGILVIPITGCNGFVDSSSAAQATPTTTTNAVTTITGSGLAIAGQLQVALSMSTADNSSTAAGTGFTDLSDFWNAISYARLESIIVAAAGPGNVSSNFTASANTSRLTQQLVFSVAPASSTVGVYSRKRRQHLPVFYSR